MERTELGFEVTNAFNNLNQIMSGSWTGSTITAVGAVNYHAGTVTVGGAKPGERVCVRVSDGNVPEEFTLKWHDAEEIACAQGETPQTWYASAVLSENSALEIADAGKHADYTNTLGGEYTVTNFTARVVPDFNHDRKIGDDDRLLVRSGEPFSFWVNNDNDYGPIGNETNNIPGRASGHPNYNNGTVDGECDLLDFFPVRIDAAPLLANLPEEGVTCRLRQDDKAVNAVYTGLGNANAGSFLTGTNEVYGPGFDQPPQRAPVFPVTKAGVELSPGFVEEIREGAGVLLLEGRAATTNPLVFEVRFDGRKVFEAELPLKLSNVEKFYKWVDFRSSASPNVSLATDKPNVFFVHGANVTRASERAWASEMYKRLWWSGAEMAFWPLKWKSDEGLSWNYHENVENAFEVAPRFGSLLSGSGGRNVVLAHSLGTVVAAAAVQNYGAQVEKLLLFNSAIPSEAFDTALFDCSTNNHLVHNEWVGYTNTCWTARWHELFPEGDARRNLTWRGRFASVAPIAVNFYSSGDEVLELYANAHNPEWYNGFSPSGNWGDRYSWHKQELWKGRRSILGLAVAGTTDWSGWGFKETWWGGRVWSAAEANAVNDPQVFATDTVFKPKPDSIMNATATRLETDRHLAYGIPALSPATGRTSLRGKVHAAYDINSGEFRTNTWPRSNDRSLGEKFLHSDIKDVAYLFVYPVFSKIVEIGGLEP